MPDSSLHKKAKRLCVYIGEGDRWRGKALYLALLETFRDRGLAGATVVRGLAGFGAHSRIHIAHFEVFSMDLPILIETVDTPENIDRIIEVIYPMVREGLITVEDTQIVKYSHRLLNPLPADRLVSEVMTQDVVALKPDMPVFQAWRTMLSTAVKAMPVLDETRKVIGMLTDEDLIEHANLRQRLSVANRMDAGILEQELRELERTPLEVKDVMSREVITIPAWENLGTATARMVKSGQVRLPVVDDEDRLAGIISRLDILRQVANVTCVEPPAPLAKGAVHTVGEVMQTDIPYIHQDDTLDAIIEKFSRTNTHRLIVIDAEGRVTGLVSDSDVVARVHPQKRQSILDALLHGKPSPGKETAKDLMSPGALTASPDLSILDAVKMMITESRKWLVVADEDLKPLGLVDRQILLESITSRF